MDKPKVASKKKPKDQPKKDTSPKVYQREKIDFELHIRELPWTEKQKALIELGGSRDCRIIFLAGPAGSSKTLSAVRIGLELLNQKKVSDLVFVRAAVESADSKLGFLPGDIAGKYEPYMGPFEDKIEELLPAGEVKRLKGDGRFIYQPINFVRGASWTARCVIIDECQNMTINEIQTLLTRIGKFTRMILCADSAQSDLPKAKQGGFDKCLNMFNTDQAEKMGIYSLAFTNEDIMRSELCKFIVQTFEDNHNILHPSH
jgi:phosphate starvation-inducible PhoH-like protein